VSAELDDLARTVRQVLARRWSPSALRAAIAGDGDGGLWAVLCEQVGVAALAIPEEFDGAGGGVAELQIVAHELGRELAPSPFLGSAVLATALLTRCGGEEFLPALAAGRRTATVAFAGETFDDRPLTVTDGLVHGTARYVLDGDTADLLLAVTADGGLFEVDPARARRRHTPTMDPTRRLAEIEFDAVPARPVATDVRVALDRALDVTRAVLAAEQAGAAARALEITVEYTKNRIQFGRPIGSFQALKHRMADMYVLVESARSAAFAAGVALDSREPDADVAVAAAKVYCSEAFSQVAAEMIQLHGGIGITWEHDAHLYFKRAHGSAQLFGDPASQLARRNLVHS
jgi:alkylation response protein AidB-like acyl-CoA dehydrogenase